MENNTIELGLGNILTPFIEAEIKQLLRYLTRDGSWEGCFRTQVVVDGIVARLKKGRLWRSVLRGHPEVSDEFVAELVAVVALSKGLVILHQGKQIQAEIAISEEENTE